MRTSDPALLCEEILLLGDKQVNSYLVRGKSYAWIGGGTAWGVPRLEEQLDRFGVDRKRIRYLVISHAHNDHCGAVPYLLHRYPWIEVVASKYGAAVLGKDKAVRLMRDLNSSTSRPAGREHSLEGVPLDFAPIPVSHPVRDGASLSLGGGLTLHFYATPGHSRCSMSVYVPEIRALFPGDSIPYPESGRTELTVTANHDYSDYLASLRRLEGLPTEIVAYEHGGALMGGEARDVVARGLEAATKQRDRIRRRFEQLGDVERLVEEISGKYSALELFRLIPGDTMRAIIERMVRSALGPR